MQKTLRGNVLSVFSNMHCIAVNNVYAGVVRSFYRNNIPHLGAYNADLIVIFIWCLLADPTATLDNELHNAQFANNDSAYQLDTAAAFLFNTLLSLLQVYRRNRLRSHCDCTYLLCCLGHDCAHEAVAEHSHNGYLNFQN